MNYGAACNTPGSLHAVKGCNKVADMSSSVLKSAPTELRIVAVYPSDMPQLILAGLDLDTRTR